MKTEVNFNTTKTSNIEKIVFEKILKKSIGYLSRKIDIVCTKLGGF